MLWRLAAVRRGADASIVPLPFGSGYGDAYAQAVADVDASFNCAAPFRERLWLRPELLGSGHCRFNCAAPFRERLLAEDFVLRTGITGFNCAAPFRERLWGWRRRYRGWQFRLQLCRSLSGAVIR